MPQYLYQIFPTRTAMLSDGATAGEQAAMSDHFAYVSRLLAEGTVILAGRTQNTDASSFGIVVYKAENDEQGLAIMHNDPAVQRGVVRGVFFPYMVALIAEANAKT